MRILFAVPAYAPADAFGGPIEVFTHLAEGLASRGHDVDVFTTSLTGLRGGRTLRSRAETVRGVRIRYLATPVRFRWMGVTPTLPLQLERAPR